MTSKITREWIDSLKKKHYITLRSTPPSTTEIWSHMHNIDALIAEAYSAGAASMKERAAKAVPTKRSAISLIAGEMNSSEWRLVSAILLYVQENITALSDLEE